MVDEIISFATNYPATYAVILIVSLLLIAELIAVVIGIFSMHDDA